MKFPQGRLMVFCKAPEAGKVMTRLANALNRAGLDGDVIAARIHHYLVQDRLNRVTSEAIAPVELWCSPGKKHPFFKECESRFPVVLKEQIGQDLGERMSYAFDDALAEKPYAVLIGTDCPGMDASVIDQAFCFLKDRSCSVICPAEDGGYVLIGLRNQQAGIFHDIEWGTSQVCKETLERLEGEVQLLPGLWDLDRIEDLKRLIKYSRELALDKEFIHYLDAINLGNH